jgi:hypothetical protein
MVPFEHIMARITIKDILLDAGIRAPKNRIPCPVHGGDNPTSFAFTDSSFFCHCCGANGGLVALTAYLHECSKREAMERLYRLAGFPPPGSETALSGSKLVPIWIATSPKHSEEYYEAENKLAWLELRHEALSCCLRIARRAVRESRMPLNQFYLMEQVYLYELEELDPVTIEAKYRLNQLKKKEYKHDDHTPSDS